MDGRRGTVLTMIGGAALGVGALWGFGDILRTIDADASLTIDVALMLLGAGAALGLSVAIAAAGLARSIERLQRTASNPSRLSDLASAIPLAAIGVFVTFDLASGAWISQQATLRVALLVCGTAGSSLAAWWAARAVRATFGLRPVRSRARMAIASGALLIGICAIATDALVYPRQYAAFHRGLLCIIVLCGATTGGAIVTVLPRKIAGPVGLIGGASGLAALIAFILGIWPGDDPRRQVFARLQAPMTARMASVLLPDAVGPDTQIDLELAALLSPPDPLPARSLDSAMPERNRFNIAWITIDTVRADHVGFGGYHLDTSPRLDAFANEATTFLNAYAQYPSSQLSMSSMFQGIYPDSTDVSQRRWRPETLGQPMSMPTVAQRLSDAGYTTHAVCSLPRDYIDRLFPFLPHGFDTFNPFTWVEELQAPTVTRRAREALGQTTDRPWMLWAHYFDPHDPYILRPEYTLEGSAVPGYDAEIRFADHHVGALLDTLKARPDWERTIVIIHSDHGEELFDHGGAFHGSSLYEEQVHVPLIVRIPGCPARRVKNVVELVDLVPTILETIGRPANDLAGQSLLRWMLPEPPVGRPPADVAFFEFDERSATSPRAVGVRRGTTKAIHHLNADVLELFDLEKDPGEKNNLALEDAAAAREIRALISTFRGMRTQRRSDGDSDDAAIATVLQASSVNEARGRILRLVASQRQHLIGRCAQALVEAEDPDRIALGLEAWSIDAQGADTARITALLDHEDERVRARAAIALAATGHPDAIARLTPMAQDPGVAAAVASVIARGLLGDAGARPLLKSRISYISGRPRVLATVALATLGDPVATRRFRSMLGQPPLDIEIHAVALRAMEKMVDPELALAMFASIEGQSHGQWWKHPGALIPGLRSYPIEIAAPLLRLDFTTRDPRTRSRIQELLGDHATAPWKGAGIQGLNARSPDDLMAANALVSACRRSQRAGIVDWAHAIEAWRRFLRAGQHDRAKTIATEVSLDTGSASWATTVVRRLEALAEAARTPPQITLQITHVDPIPRDGSTLAYAEVTVSLAAEGGAVIGGRQAPATLLQVSLEDGRGGRPLTSAGLPTPGLLPGESTTMMIGFHYPPRRSGPMRLVVTAQGASPASASIR